VIGKKDPGGQIEPMHRARPVVGESQQSEIGLHDPARRDRSLSRRTVMKKYRFERKGRRSFDTALEYATAEIIAREETRTAKPAVRATC